LLIKCRDWVVEWFPKDKKINSDWFLAPLSYEKEIKEERNNFNNLMKRSKRFETKQSFFNEEGESKPNGFAEVGNEINLLKEKKLN
jgi:hypothetical protein